MLFMWSLQVQSVAWNPAEGPVLLTGAFDRSACLVDVRAPGGAPARWQLSADCEAACWAPHAPTSFLVASEDGIVACFDARTGAGAFWLLLVFVAFTLILRCTLRLKCVSICFLAT